ncbi:hypothetical protein CK203_117652 [Vitis vinifera]|uniref:Histone deacetylase complex subunit SAP30 Sin3 binding domain-containing protein n=1 Tax=Vitis vinifera TaxID=29760 RepID=A0A438C830_VITVI|nr:hypothetical protein CK203_117652 [Vitis vinifera]
MLEAVESSVNGGFSQLQSCGDSSEEELSVLPRHTKVVVTGNNRTKSVLVGLQGVVKKAVGLGGWHWLDLAVESGLLYDIASLGILENFVQFDVLTNGIEVKLQRNALSVIEAPTGNEEDDDLEFENMQWNGSDMVLVRVKGEGEDEYDEMPSFFFLSSVLEIVSGLPWLFRRGKCLSKLFNCACACADFAASDDTQKSHRSRHRTHKSSGSSHKTMSRSLSCDSQSKGSISTPRGSTVDLSKLEMAALWRYLRHFNLVDGIPNPSKEQLIDVVQRHFVTQQMDELQVIVGFVQAAKRLKTVCK